MYDSQLRKPPEGVTLGEFSTLVFEVMARHTSFPWAILSAQCRRLELDPANLDRSTMEPLVAALSSAVGQFTTPENELECRTALRALF
ncbi:MAG: hypothetical protein AAFQ82_00280 [Myxococcota bacterium]